MTKRHISLYEAFVDYGIKSSSVVLRFTEEAFLSLINNYIQETYKYYGCELKVVAGADNVVSVYGFNDLHSAMCPGIEPPAYLRGSGQWYMREIYDGLFGVNNVVETKVLYMGSDRYDVEITTVVLKSDELKVLTNDIKSENSLLDITRRQIVALEDKLFCTLNNLHKCD